ncbi:YhcH/YjgK/YiaL family protein [Streptococcus himalayensis]|uniref:Beta-galactosidase subunit beta n=1 Tax=Streptococcus himalayensis TaxID=1888195 RepID=A0A917A6U0_9STRE|nr:YhcH/YjgK/YiaL family protein [Streptococcus himalayensis]GGE30511.1 beta-galactosidase subunit beta [Streptococcus himalayensis]
MIFDQLQQIGRYRGLHPHLDQAIDYLLTHDMASFALGRYAINEDKVFFFIQDNQLNQEPDDCFEYHERFADFHFLLEGRELMHYGQQVKEVIKDYEEESDIGFVSCNLATPLHLTEENIAIFLPNEPHQPNLYDRAGERVKKCVVKVLID